MVRQKNRQNYFTEKKGFSLDTFFRIQADRSTAEFQHHLNSTSESENIVEHKIVDQTKVVPLLGGLIILIMFTSILSNISLNRFVLYASSNIHNNMLSRLIKTPLRFFEMNPCGNFEI